VTPRDYPGPSALIGFVTSGRSVLSMKGKNLPVIKRSRTALALLTVAFGLSGPLLAERAKPKAAAAPGARREDTGRGVAQDGSLNDQQGTRAREHACDRSGRPLDETKPERGGAVRLRSTPGLLRRETQSALAGTGRQSSVSRGHGSDGVAVFDGPFGHVEADRARQTHATEAIAVVWGPAK